MTAPSEIRGIGKLRRFRRLVASAATGLTAVLCVVFLTTSPALATSSPNSLPIPNGDRGVNCAAMGPIGALQAVMCVELGLYTNSAGQKFVTAQADALCDSVNVLNSWAQCSNVVITATVANGAGYTGWTTKACGHSNGACQTFETSNSADNNFFPYGGLPITNNGPCLNNVWAVIDSTRANTFVTLPAPANQNVYLSGNLEDGHYSQVCLTNGIFSVS